MDLSPYTDTLHRLADLLDGRLELDEKFLASNPEQPSEPQSQYPPIEFIREKHGEFTEAIAKSLREWDATQSEIEYLGWDERELLEKLYYACSRGIMELQGKADHLTNRAIGLGSIKAGEAQIGLADQGIEKVTTLVHAVMRKRQHADARKAINEFVDRLLELQVDVYEYLSQDD